MSASGASGPSVVYVYGRKRGSNFKIPLKQPLSARQQNTFKWRYASGPMMAQHRMLCIRETPKRVLFTNSEEPKNNAFHQGLHCL